MEQVSGVVERITYCDKENGFGVIKVKVSGYRELITMVGNLSTVNIGSVVNALGIWRTNSKFGKQFKVENWKESLPSDNYEIERYLGSGLIRGIGPKIAKVIVDTFGSRTFEIIERTPEKLLGIPKLGKKKIELIISSWKEQKNIKELMIFLQKIGIGASFVRKIFNAYGKESINIIKDNPYQLIDDINGIGFRTADLIAQGLGLNRESYDRCRTGIIYILEYMANTEGHCYLPFDELIDKCSRMLQIDPCKIIMTYDSLVSNGELIVDSDRVYLPSFFRSEIGLANKIMNIKKFNKFVEVYDENLDMEIEKVEMKNGIKYDDVQRSAIKSAVSSKFTIITGGAGVGKTTITKAIINIFENRNKKVILTAPTGKAAKRLAEVTGIEAKTIHRLLEAQKDGYFYRNSEHKIDGDVLIVDETSMVDIILMNNLLKAVPDGMTVILIGDSNQLASVGPGNVLKDIIKSACVEVIELKKIYRQTKISNIILNSHKINDGEMIDLNNKPDSDFFFIKEDNDERCVDIILNLCSDRLPAYYKVNPISDIQVITPMKRGCLGVDNLNRALQENLNHNRNFLRRDTIEYRMCDKVMQIKNNYEKQVFNGDIGVICSIDKEREELEVNFDCRTIRYNISELDEINLAYACTIHKSQGAEYPIVIIPMTTSHFVMLERNLLYTGVTRARKICILVGKEDAVQRAIENNLSRVRYTSLSQRLS